MIEHTGDETTSGHYNAYVLTDGEWTKRSDTEGSRVSWDVVATTEAYILIWEKISENQNRYICNTLSRDLEEDRIGFSQGKEKEFTKKSTTSNQPNPTTEEEIEMSVDEVSMK